MPTPPSHPERSDGLTPEQALDGFVRAYEAVDKALADEQDPEKAFDVAGQLAAQIDGMRTRAGSLRARLALRLAEARKYSLSKLAQVTGVTKRRAQEWVERARQERGT